MFIFYLWVNVVFSCSHKVVSMETSCLEISICNYGYHTKPYSELNNGEKAVEGTEVRETEKKNLVPFLIIKLQAV